VRVSRSRPPEGWEEVFSGLCVEASVIQAVLETRGLRAVTQQFSSQWLIGSVVDDCRVYVPVDQAEAARDALAESPDPLDDA